VTLKYCVTDYALPLGSTAKIPWGRLDKFKDRYILPLCLPIGLKTLCPTSMGLSDVYQFYDHIISSQKSPDKQLFQFAFHDSILPSLTPPATENPPLIASPLAHSPLPKLLSPLRDMQPEIRGSDNGADNKNIDDETDTNASTGAKKRKKRYYMTALHVPTALTFSIPVMLMENLKTTLK
jgi:hypothetical protein